MAAPIGAAQAAAAYRAVANPPATEGGAGFGATLQRAIGGAVESGHAADRATGGALLGQGGISEVVMAISQAELALQTTVAVRDRVVSAYQDVMRMPI